MAEADKSQPRRELTSAELGALAHLYRGEIYRSTVWRTRLDTSTNWGGRDVGRGSFHHVLVTERYAVPWFFPAEVRLRQAASCR